MYRRDTEDGRTVEATLVLNQNPMARGTLRGMLQKLEISLEDFKKELK